MRFLSNKGFKLTSRIPLLLSARKSESLIPMKKPTEKLTLDVNSMISLPMSSSLPANAPDALPVSNPPTNLRLSNIFNKTRMSLLWWVFGLFDVKKKLFKIRAGFLTRIKFKFDWNLLHFIDWWWCQWRSSFEKSRNWYCHGLWYRCC